MGKLLRKPDWGRYPDVMAAALYQNRKNRRKQIQTAYTEDATHIVVEYNGAVSGDLSSGIKFVVDGVSGSPSAAVAISNTKVRYTVLAISSGQDLWMSYDASIGSLLIDNKDAISISNFQVRNTL